MIKLELEPEVINPSARHKKRFFSLTNRKTRRKLAQKTHFSHSNDGEVQRRSYIQQIRTGELKKEVITTHHRTFIHSLC